ncbi:MAG: TetR/AcrR family transcriptional regulator [Verrucomicrobiaceae bacterium]|nr:TetR/AcrR family transcriptional regulator [Verrucomicrobiaceae bacterium]
MTETTALDHLNTDDAVAPDFRVRVAQEKRTRMRARLLSAILDIYLPNERGGAAVIDDVVQKANVSRGTFYKYFDSLDEAVAALGQEMAAEMLLAFERLFSGNADPAIAAAAGTLLTLTRAAMEPRWAAFTARVDFVVYLSQRNPMFEIVTHSLLRAKDAGFLHFSSIEAAADFVIGVTLEGVRRAAHGHPCKRDYISEIAQMNMLGLGMAPTIAEQAVGNIWRELIEYAPNLSWWNEEAIN